VTVAAGFARATRNPNELGGVEDELARTLPLGFPVDG
jgi:hypothetical protein